MEIKNEVFVGIDVGKETLVVNSGKKEWEVSNTPKVVNGLVRQLVKLTPALVLVESTGGYEELLMEHLWRAEIPVCRVNPARSKAFAISLGLYAKTDSIDAGMLRTFAQKLRPAPTPAPSPEVRKMKALIDRRVQLVEMMTREKNHLKAPLMDELAKKSIRKILDALKTELKEFDAYIVEVIKASEELSAKAEVLQSQIGVGPVLTMMLLGDMPELGTISRKKIGALVGVAPMDNQSGLISKKRCIRGGRKHVRSILYMATVAAVRHNPHLKSFFLNMVKKGKHKMVALIATMRRLLIILNASMREFLEAKQLIQSVALSS